ncbi:CBS domain-containing protein [Candidatus Woesearchaeota archaeon]|nr:CBS domain-containing protein [Candidatus Woesearchaeota archaeon]
MKTGVSVADVMTEHPIVVGPETSLQECARVMTENHVGAVLIQGRGDLLGIVSEQDIVRKSVLNGDIPSRIRVKDIMVSKLITISPSADVFDAVRVMAEENIRHLPVIRGENFAGVVTMKDILKIQPELFQILVDKIELREEERKVKY